MSMYGRDVNTSVYGCEFVRAYVYWHNDIPSVHSNGIINAKHAKLPKNLHEGVCVFVLCTRPRECASACQYVYLCVCVRCVCGVCVRVVCLCLYVPMCVNVDALCVCKYHLHTTRT